MPFEKLERTKTGGALNKVIGISVSPSGYGTIEALFGEEVRNHLNIRAGDTIAFFIGTGSDHGFVALQKAPHGYRVGMPHNGAAPRVRFPSGAKATFQRPAKRIRPPYRIDDDMLIIDLRELLIVEPQAKAA